MRSFFCEDGGGGGEGGGVGGIVCLEGAAIARPREPGEILDLRVR